MYQPLSSIINHISTIINTETQPPAVAQCPPPAAAPWRSSPWPWGTGAAAVHGSSEWSWAWAAGTAARRAAHRWWETSAPKVPLRDERCWIQTNQWYKWLGYWMLLDVHDMAMGDRLVVLWNSGEKKWTSSPGFPNGLPRPPPLEMDRTGWASPAAKKLLSVQRGEGKSLEAPRDRWAPKGAAVKWVRSRWEDTLRSG